MMRNNRAARAAGLGVASAFVAAALLLWGYAGSTPSTSPTASATLTSSPGASSTTNLGPSPSATPMPTPVAMFAPTGSMAQARMSHSATLLSDGRVLIAGGKKVRDSAVDYLSSAELYDPSTGKFTRTGSLSVARSGHTATLLADGRVLIAGGYGLRTSECWGMCSNYAGLTSAELYDPRTGKFTKTGSLSAARTGHAGFRLADGRVLLVGGSWVGAEVYNPASGRFSRLGSLTEIAVASAALLADGRVFVVGGWDGACSVGLLSPGSAVLAPITAQPKACPDSATALTDGRVLVFEGGYVETYDRRVGQYTAVGSIPGEYTSWRQARAILLGDGRVVFSGGVNAQGSAVGLAGIYDPAGGLWSVGPMGTARSAHTATLLPDGSVLIAGGSAGKALASAELLSLVPAP